MGAAKEARDRKSCRAHFDREAKERRAADEAREIRRAAERAAERAYREACRAYAAQQERARLAPYIDADGFLTEAAYRRMRGDELAQPRPRA